MTKITKCPPGYEPLDKKHDLAGHFWDPGEDYAENEYEYDGGKGHLRVKNYDRRAHLDRVARGSG